MIRLFLTALNSPAGQEGRKIVFNDAHSTFYLWLFMASNIRQITVRIVREEIHCRHYMGYSLCLAPRVLLCVQSHRQDSIYHDLCYTSRCGALAGMRNSELSSMRDQSNNPIHHELMHYHEAISHTCTHARTRTHAHARTHTHTQKK